MGETGLKFESWNVKNHTKNAFQNHFYCFLKEIWTLKSSCSLKSPTNAIIMLVLSPLASIIVIQIYNIWNMLKLSLHVSWQQIKGTTKACILVLPPLLNHTHKAMCVVLGKSQCKLKKIFHLCGCMLIFPQSTDSKLCFWFSFCIGYTWGTITVFKGAYHRTVHVCLTFTLRSG